MRRPRPSPTPGVAFAALDRLLTDVETPIGDRIRSADAIFDHALKVCRQLRMQLTADYARCLHENPEALQEHREWQRKQADATDRRPGSTGA